MSTWSFGTQIFQVYRILMKKSKPFSGEEILISGLGWRFGVENEDDLPIRNK